MANEFRLSYTANEINEKLRNMVSSINGKTPDADGNINIEVSSGGAGVSSWNDLTDKPFGEVTTRVEGDTLTWDGNKDGLVNVMGMIYKISDNVLTADDVQNGATVTTSDGTQTSCSGSEIREWIETYGVVAFSGVYSVPSDNFEASGIVFPEAGIYVMADDAAPAYVKSITIPGYTGFVSEQTVITPIDTKYLPEHLQFGTETKVVKDTVIFDGSFEGKTYVEVMDGQGLLKLSDVVPTAEELAHGFIMTTFEGDVLDYSQEGTYEELLANIQEMQNEYNGMIMFEGFYVFPTDNFDFMGMVIVPEAGLYTVGMPEMNISYLTSLQIINFERFTGEIAVDTPIELKYLPKSHWFGQDSLIYTRINKIEFPSNTDNLHCVEYDGCMWYQVSEEYIRESYLRSGYIAYGNVPNSDMLVNEYQCNYADGQGSYLICAGGYIMSLYNNITLDNATFNEGTYFKVDASGNKVTRIEGLTGLYSANVITPMPINKAYLPYDIATTEQIDKLAIYVFGKSGGSGTDTGVVQTMINNAIYGAMEASY